MIRQLANDGMDPNAVEELLRNGIEVNTTHCEGEASRKVQEYDITTARPPPRCANR